MKNPYRVYFILVVCVFSLFQYGRAETSSETEALDAGTKIFIKLFREISPRISEAKQHPEDFPDWAVSCSGHFITESGKYEIVITPDGEFVYAFRSSGYIYRIIYGNIVEGNRQRIRVNFNSSIDHESEPYLSESYCFVYWDDFTYLIPENMMIDFCQEVNNGDIRINTYNKYAILNIFGWCGTHPWTGKGDITVPDEYKQFMLNKILYAKITKVDELIESTEGVEADKYHQGILTIGKGKKHGVFVGLRFYSKPGGMLPILFEVTEVSEKSCKAKFRYKAHSNPYALEKMTPRRGTEVNTYYWHIFKPTPTPISLQHDQFSQTRQRYLFDAPGV